MPSIDLNCDLGESFGAYTIGMDAEILPYVTSANIACDHNQLMMELIQRIAKKHGMVALLHEKPFEGINGSGKQSVLL